MADFTMIVPNWNGGSVLPGMLESSVGQVVRGNGRLLLFDNGSKDGSDGDACEKYGNEPWFSMVRSPVNLGFAAGVNMAMKEVDTREVVIANSDTVFLPGSLDNLLKGLRRHPEAGLAGPMLLWPDGRLQESMRDFPFPGRLIAEHLPVLRKRSFRHRGHSLETRCDWVVGAVMAVRTEAFREVGGFDEDYFFYHEETDLQYRMQRAGWETWLIPSSRIIHLEGASATQLFGGETYLRYIPAKLRFLSKHAGAGSRAAFRGWMSALMLWRTAAGLLKPSLARRDGRFRASYCGKALKLLFGSTERKIL